MSDAKTLTTAEVKGWRATLGQCWAARIGPLGHEVVIEGDRILATTRALEALAAERDEAPNWGVVRRLNDEWTEEAEKLLARAEKAERERDEARARVSALETALLDACREKVVHGHTTTLLSEAKELRVAGIEQLFLDADQIRDEAKTLVSDLVAALEGLFVEYDYLCSEGSKYALRLGRVPDHACAECVPGGPIVEPGFRCREHAARSALAKAKPANRGLPKNCDTCWSDGCQVCDRANLSRWKAKPKGVTT